MTKKEAIKILHGTVYNPLYYDALCMAIDALEFEQDNINDVLRDIEAEVKKQIVDLQDGSEEWRVYVNETVLETLEIIDKYIIKED